MLKRAFSFLGSQEPSKTNSEIDPNETEDEEPPIHVNPRINQIEKLTNQSIQSIDLTPPHHSIPTHIPTTSRQRGRPRKFKLSDETHSSNSTQSIDQNHYSSNPTRSIHTNTQLIINNQTYPFELPGSLTGPIEELSLSDMFPGLTPFQSIQLINDPLSNLIETPNIVLNKPIPPCSFRKLTLYPDDSNQLDPCLDYIQYIEPTEHELDERIEYDMDSQDKFWLQLINRMRKDECLGDIPDSFFELVMDRLEKEWFMLTKELIKSEKDDFFEYPQDISCCICQECENSNAIVFCDGCNLAVHQGIQLIFGLIKVYSNHSELYLDCYGVPFIPEGQWLCRKCMLSPEAPVTCLFCPNTDGAFKQTINSKWVHSMCALWIPEVSVSNPVYMEPIENVENVPKSRYKLVCFICKQKMGACIQCDNKNCFTAFHVTCGRAIKLYMNIKVNGERVSMRAFCDRHVPKSHTSDNIQIQHHLRQFQKNSSQSKKKDKGGAMKSQRNKKRLMSPVIPLYVYNQIMNRLKNIKYPKKSLFIIEVSKYWALKRELRRGAPLLKRLHLEPYSLTRLSKEDEELRAMRYQELMKLHVYANRIMSIMEYTKRREKKKLMGIRTVIEYVDAFSFPIKRFQLDVLFEVKRCDPKHYFLDPVDTDLVPDYLNYIKTPMDFTQIKQKIENYEYNDFSSLESDLIQICQNAKIYNQPCTSFYKTAQRIEKQIEKSISIHAKEYSLLNIQTSSGCLNVEFDFSIFNQICKENLQSEYEINMFENLVDKSFNAIKQ